MHQATSPQKTSPMAQLDLARSGPGTPTHRFKRLMDELEKRFPHPRPFDSTKAPEDYALEAIDRLIDSAK